MAYRVIVLGATGSLGGAALNVLKDRELFRVVGLSTLSKTHRLLEIAAQYPLEAVASVKPFDAEVPYQVFTGANAAQELVEALRPDVVINAIAGASGLLPGLSALKVGATLLMGSKEGLLLGGRYLVENPWEGRLLPLDSEHVALQELLKEGIQPKRVILTGSGGPLRDIQDLGAVSLEDVLSHPVWEMGEKITVDSATLINKAFEVIEAVYLFGISEDRIEVRMDKDARIHAAVMDSEGNWYAYEGAPDMDHVVAHQLGLEEWGRIIRGEEAARLVQRLEEFPLTTLAWAGHQVLKRGDCAVAALVGMDEVIIGEFLDAKAHFSEVIDALRYGIERLPRGSCEGLSDTIGTYFIGRTLGIEALRSVIDQRPST